MMMKTLSEIMSREVITVGPQMTLREVAGIFAEAHISGAPVVEGGRVLGVISSSDLLAFAAEAPGREEEGVEGEPEPVDVGLPEEDVPAALYFTEFWSNGSADVFERMAGGEERERLLNGYRAGDLMTRTIYALPSTTPVATAADYMLKADIHRVLVVDDQRLVGVVTTTDMVREMGGIAP